MTLSKVSGGDLLAGLGGLALIGLLFAPWFGEKASSATEFRPADEEIVLDLLAWDVFTLTLVPLIIVALFGLTLLITTAYERTTAWPVAAQVFGVTLATIAILWLVIRLINEPGDNALVEIRWGAYAGLGTLALIWFGFAWSMRDEVRP